ncbi:hypothetical protein [Streptomyces sp. 840.1]|uniref:hypothetical protein n=1 Tax=Streptomyces sp. 840.1 TaxID=2485152 RepID=UPI0011CEA79A|nr:hypothetical protein [Streptomyces sp. 840.1]
MPAIVAVGIRPVGVAFPVRGPVQGPVRCQVPAAGSRPQAGRPRREAGGSFVHLRVTLTDTHGARVSQTVVRAYEVR